MKRVLYDRSCHILRNLTVRLKHIHRPCMACDLGVLIRCEDALKKAEHDLAKVKNYLLGGD